MYENLYALLGNTLSEDENILKILMEFQLVLKKIIVLLNYG